MNIDNTLRFGGIYVIESLRPRDRRTGSDLIDEVLTPARFDHTPHLEIAYRPVVSASDFLAELDRVPEWMREKEVRPILHIEAHGDESGIEVTSGEHVPWAAFAERLRTINRLTELNLLVVMAACRGIYLTQLLQPTAPAPAWGIVGPRVDQRVHVLYATMRTLYQRLLVDRTGGFLAQMNPGLEPDEWVYALSHAQWLFCESFRRYVADATPAALAERENAIVAEITRRRDYDLRAAMDAREMARNHLPRHAEYFRTLHHQFFMCDEFPAHATRFAMAYEDCAGRAPVDTRATTTER